MKPKMVALTLRAAPEGFLGPHPTPEIKNHVLFHFSFFNNPTGVNPRGFLARWSKLFKDIVIQ